ncbi:FliO/MopB family protein [Kineococcus terrestris]|uniref:FliO/MopB family protein n=1 Tax=Kineococcus terrestris TaxID=2044856 RepID=UPI0034DB475D
MEALAALARMSVSLVAVLGLLYLAARWLRRSKLAGLGGTEAVAVLTRQGVGHKAGVAVVRVGERALVVGVTEQQVTLLAETTLAELGAADAVDEPAGDAAAGPAAPPLAQPVTVELPGTGEPVARVVGERYTRRAGTRGTAGPTAPTSTPTSTPAPTPATTPATTSAPAAATAVAPAPGRHSAPTGALAGSALSPATWTKAVDVLRERTTRR